MHTGPAVHVTSTSDISLVELRALTAGLHGRLPLSLHPAQGFFKSLEAPSWIKFLQEPQFWLEALGGGIALDLVKGGTRHLWSKRGMVAALGRDGANAARREFAATLAILRNRYGPGTELIIGVPVPDDWHVTGLPLVGDDPEVLENQVALFLAYLPQIEARLADTSDQRFGPLHLSLTMDGDMKADWMERRTLKRHHETLRLEDVV